MGLSHSSTPFGSRSELRAAHGRAADAAARPGALGRAAARLLLAAIRFYQACFSPAIPVGCKFYPSCSHYAAEAIEKHGAGRGSLLAVKRLLRCRPFTKGGVDLVPDLEKHIVNKSGAGESNINARESLPAEENENHSARRAHDSGSSNRNGVRL